MENMKHKLCITTYVIGRDYQEFIPFFIYSIYRAYPHYDVIIFCGESLHKNVKKSLKLLEGSISFKIIENAYTFEPRNISRRVSSCGKRWFLYCDDFTRYDYIYIGDIDIFITKEEPDIIEQHLIHCDAINLDYSNIVRRAHHDRLSGLQFVKREPYFDKMLPVIEKYERLMRENKLDYSDDEYMLYDMVEESGLGMCHQAKGKEKADPTSPEFRPDHGVHLAVFRNLLVKKRKISHPVFLEKMKALQKVIDGDLLFKQIEANIESKMVKRIFKRVRKFSF